MKLNNSRQPLCVIIAESPTHARIQMSDDLLLTVSQVCRRFPGARGAKHVTPSTVTRWILNGCPDRCGTRIRLAATRCGSRWLVKPTDLDVFFAALAADPTPTTPRPITRTQTQQQRAAERAGERLKKMGA
jgi:hypothetical protein